MGSAKSKGALRILVIGNHNAGKTHFLDMFHLGHDSTKVPTHGYYETVFKHQGVQDVILTEYGGSVEWAKVLRACQHSFDAIYMVINTNSTREDVMECNNALLMMSELVPGVPIAVVWNVTEPAKHTLQWMPRATSTCVCFLDFSKVDWRERVGELVEWTIVNKNIAKKKAK